MAHRLIVLALVLAAVSASGAPGPAPEQVLRDYVVLPPIGAGGRSPLHRDPVEAQIVAGTWHPPRPGELLAAADGREQRWEAASAGESGALGGTWGYADAAVTAPADRVLLLQAQGHQMVYVNGEPRTGDPYGYGYVRLPVLLRAGANEFLFLRGRGAFSARLLPPAGEAMLDTRDSTLPDLRLGEKREHWGAVLVLNASSVALTGASLSARLGGGSASTPMPPVPPLGVRKVGFRIGASPTPKGSEAPLDLELRRGGKTLDRAAVKLRVRSPEQTYKRTFRSDIDGSIQYYAVNPAPPGVTTVPPALFLTLHGAGVEAIGQADAYSPKRWGHLVAPTNRRPFGFDWEDWGRMDALEVLETAAKELRTDPQRVYLTGHSMGGHGVWQLGVLFPDRFAAIGPSAGWISLRTYAGLPRPELGGETLALLNRAGASSETLTLARNYAQLGVYILHGAADDNVPAREARVMQEQLAGFHHDFVYHEQPGAGHWWDASDEPGADCVDWLPMFDFFARRARPEDRAVRQVEFATVSPGVSARCRWVTIEAQERALNPSTVNLRLDPGRRRVTGATENVARLSLDLTTLGSDPLTVMLDDQTVPDAQHLTPAAHRWLYREGGRWRTGAEPDPALKNPRRCGPFKEAFRNRMLFVYGTAGSEPENSWALARARYDAESFWYRGDGSVDVVPDTAFDPRAEPDRSVILYGSAETNRAWKPLLDGSPVEVRKGLVRIGDRRVSGEDLACLFVRPRPGSAVACVAAVTGSGLPGMRLTDRIPYFNSGVAYPDCVVLDSTTLALGSAGLRCAGFFGNDWGVESGEWAWAR